MRFRTIDDSGDWTFGRGLGNYSLENDAVRLNIRTRLLSWLNDCFFAQNEGIDWVNRLGSPGQRQLLEQDIRRIITQTPDVIEIISFSTSLVSRRFSGQYSVRTIYSTITGEIGRVF